MSLYHLSPTEFWRIDNLLGGEVMHLLNVKSQFNQYMIIWYSEVNNYEDIDMLWNLAFIWLMALKLRSDDYNLSYAKSIYNSHKLTFLKMFYLYFKLHLLAESEISIYICHNSLWYLSNANNIVKRRV